MAALEVPAVVLSPLQAAVAQSLCVSGGAPGPALLASSGAKPSTLVGLIRLGVITWRHAGGRDPLYHLTAYGRLVVCGSLSDDESDTYTETEDDMTDETPLTEDLAAAQDEAKTDPKPTAKKKVTSPRSRATKKNAAPVEDVTDTPDAPIPAATKASAGDFQPLFDSLLGAVKDAVKTVDKPVVEKKAAYTRVSILGKAAIYLNFPTSKAVRVEVPQVDGSGYDVIKATSDSDIPAVLALVDGRVKALQAKAAAKAAA